MGIFGRSKGNKQLKKKVKREYKALKKSGDVKKAKGLGLSKKEMKEGIRKRIAEKAVIRKRNVTAKKASDNIAKKESSVATSKDMATERSNRSAERQASMQSKADAANKDIKSRKAQGATNERVRSNIKSEATAKPGGEYDITNRSGDKKRAKKPKAMYGAKVKAVKKAKAGAALKSVPSKAKGLSKLPKGVRNKMGYMKDGGKVKKVKKKDLKSLEEAKQNLKNRAKSSDIQKNNPNGRIGNTRALNKKKKFTDMENETIARGVAKNQGRTYVSEGVRSMNMKSIGKIPTMKPSIIKSLKKASKMMKDGGKVGDPPKKTKKELYEINEKRYKSIRKSMTDKDGNFKSEDDVEKFKSMFRGNKRPETSARMDNTRTPKIRVKKK